MHSTNDASADNDEFLLSNIKKSSDKLDETKINRFQHSQTAKNLLKALQKGQEA
jgi:hypothetical protein